MEALRVIERAHSGAGATSRTAVQHYNGQATRISAGLEIKPVPVPDVEIASAQRFKRGKHK